MGGGRRERRAERVITRCEGQVSKGSRRVEKEEEKVLRKRRRRMRRKKRTGGAGNRKEQVDFEKRRGTRRE